jgi:maltooligosyltrehalose trehalohydrolase
VRGDRDGYVLSVNGGRAAERGAKRRWLPFGAELTATGVDFRVWAPARRAVEVVVEARAPAPLAPEGDGWFSGELAGLGAGARYRYRLDGDLLRPDPASRFQPEGPHGPSEVVDPGRFCWTDDGWRGLRLPGQVLYELHVGTFTPEGTWAAAARELAALAELGVTAVEVMPVAEFPGRFGWGYDGVDLFAPSHLYGTPDDLRAFVDRAHGLGLGVILDVVYNHLGPDGNYLPDFAPGYFTDRHETEWGAPFDFDGPGTGPVRALVVENAGYWISEFRIDGLRLDATQAIFDGSPQHVLCDVGRRAREAAAGRGVLVIAENEPQQPRVVRPCEQGGYGFDAQWNDDFHHAATVALTGRREAYYSDYGGTPQELVSLAKHGFLFQGQRSAWQRKGRGAPARGVPRAALVCCLENHDQVANSARGERTRALTTPGRWRALTAFLLLGPWTPMLFQGQEHGTLRPFRYFADHVPALAHVVRCGRAGFLRQFPSIAAPDLRDQLDDPGDLATFAGCKLDRADVRPELVALHRDLLELRRADPVIRAQGADGLDGAVLGPEAFAVRWSAPAGEDRLLLVNLGADLVQPSLSEPLVAPPEGRRWAGLWSSEHPRYGGRGTPAPFDASGARVVAHAAVLLVPGEPADA